MPTPIGPRLNDEWSIGAAQCLYSKDGTWFHRLVLFPGALCDQNGYVRFETETEYLNCPGANIAKRTNIHRGINRLPGYVRMRT